MSTHRMSPTRGYRDVVPDPDGVRRCRCGCGEPVEKGRRNWASQRCIDQHRIRSDPGFVRRTVEERDRGVCAACGIDTAAESARLTGLLADLGTEVSTELSWEPVARTLHGPLAAWLGLPAQSLSPFRDWPDRDPWPATLWIRWRVEIPWEADHVTPVIEGGGECGLDGYRTLCLPCHRRETAALARRRARARSRQTAIPGCP